MCLMNTKNLYRMSRKRKMKPRAILKKTKVVKNITEYTLNTNGLRVLYVEKPGTGVVTSDIVYKVGSRDEARGETGIAHMLEHMLFKPTKHDLKRKIDSSAMHFEREHGVALNASTWKDRTNYYFSYPTKYFSQALKIEAERMHDVVLSDKEFKPEQGNVLSEHDMYAGDELFLLSVAMHGAAFHLHPYGHETIGFRSDIEAYTPEKLKRFYKKFYTPNNATLIVVGDISEREMKKTVLKYFGNIKITNSDIARKNFVEPSQSGIRKITVKKPSTKQVLGFGLRHESFPSKNWFETYVVLNLLAGDSDSLLYKELVDTGLVAAIEMSIEPTRDPNIAELFITLADGITHEKVEVRVLELLCRITSKQAAPFLKRTIAKTVLEELIQKESSMGFVSSLREYVSADAWDTFFDSKKILESLTSKEVLTRMRNMFDEDHLIVGYFKGTR